MENLKNLLERLEKVEDVMSFEMGENKVSVCFNDCDGFDSNWSELDRDYINLEGVLEAQRILEDLESNGVEVHITFTSEDI